MPSDSVNLVLSTAFIAFIAALSHKSGVFHALMANVQLHESSKYPQKMVKSCIFRHFRYTSVLTLSEIIL